MKIKDLFNYLYILIGVPFLFLVIITSRGFTEIKTLLLAILIVIAFIETILIKKSINKSFTYFIFIFVIYFTFSLLFGIFNGFPFDFIIDFSLIQYFVITPIGVLFLSSIFYKNKLRIDFLFKTLKFVTLITVIMDVLKVFSHQGIIPDIDFLNLIMIASDIGEHITLRVSNEAALMFLVPMYIILFFHESQKKNKFIYSLIVLFGIVYSMLSGRKALMILEMFTLLIMFIKQLNITKKGLKNIFLFIVILFVLNSMLNVFSNAIGMNNIIDKIIETVQAGISSNASGVISRGNNIKALLDMWANSPLIGFGLNSYAIISIANSLTKWSYEVVYVALLAQTGLIGVTIFFSGVCTILYKLIKKYRYYKRSEYLAVFFGFSSFIICGASNPLVYYIWPWIIAMVAVQNNLEFSK